MNTNEYLIKFNSDSGICSFKAKCTILRDGDIKILIHEEHGYPEPLKEWVRETNTFLTSRQGYCAGYKRDLILVDNDSNETKLYDAMIVSCVFSDTTDAVELKVRWNTINGTPIIYESNIFETVEDLISILSKRGVEITVNEHFPFLNLSTRGVVPVKSISIGDSSIYTYSVGNNSSDNNYHDTTTEMDVVVRGLSNVMIKYLKEYINEKEQ